MIMAFKANMLTKDGKKMMYLIYIVLCMTECIPGDWCIVNLGIMPDSYSISWLLKHLLFSIMLTGSIERPLLIIG